MRTQSDLVQPSIQNPVLQACSESTRADLLEHGVLKVFDSGALLFRKGEPAAQVLFLLDGTLQMDKTSSRGRRQVICSLTPSECDGICLLLFGDQGLADVRGVEAGHVLILDRAQFQLLAAQDPALCNAAWQGAANCMAHLSDLVEHLSFHKVAQRVSSALLDNTEKNGDLIYMTQAELAAEVGTTREVVARCLAGLQTAGVIRLGRGRITVLSRERLGQVA